MASKITPQNNPKNKQGTDLFQTLIEKDFEFRKLAQNHEAYEKKLQAFSKQKFISSDDEVSMKKIQKKKLILKDKMLQKMAGA